MTSQLFLLKIREYKDLCLNKKKRIYVQFSTIKIDHDKGKMNDKTKKIFMQQPLR